MQHREEFKRYGNSAPKSCILRLQAKKRKPLVQNPAGCSCEKPFHHDFLAHLAAPPLPRLNIKTRLSSKCLLNLAAAYNILMAAPSYCHNKVEYLGYRLIQYNSQPAGLFQEFKTKQNSPNEFAKLSISPHKSNRPTNGSQVV